LEVNETTLYEHSQLKTLTMTRLSAFLFSLLPASIVVGSNPNLNEASTSGFIENCGQIVNQHGKPNDDVDFLWATANSANVQLRSNGLSYDFFRKLEGGKIEYRRLDMTLVNAHPNRQAILSDASEDYYNYSASDVSGLYKYGSVRYDDVYQGIDWDLRVTDEGFLKFNFLLESAESYSDIIIEYAGFDDFEVSEGNLIFSLAGHKVVESIPASWTDSGKSIAMKYEIISCEAQKLLVKLIPENDVALSNDEGLIIDPIAEFSWGTYYGDTLYDSANSVVTDSLGNLFIVGTTQSFQTIASSGSFQDVFAGGNTDAFLARFNAHGLRQWATYFGGSGDEHGLAIDIDRHQNVYISGTTSSPDSIAQDSTSNQINFGGGIDGFLARFNRFGSMIWNTYIGGSGTDKALSCAANANGRILVAGSTNSAGFLENDSITPALPLAGDIDGFLAEFNQEGALIWSSYFGGEAEDYISQVTLDSLNNVILVGTSRSQTGISIGDSQQSSLEGGSDGFVAKYDSSRVLLWSTYIGGETNDSLSSLTTVNSNIYACGVTGGELPYLDSNSNQLDFGGMSDGFLFRLDEFGNLEWLTYLGGESLDVAHSISRDREGSLYVVGVTESDSCFGDTLSHQRYNQGRQDGFISKYLQDGSISWTTFQGGPGDDLANGVSVFGRTSVYVVGETDSDSTFAKEGRYEDIHQENLGGSSTDAFFTRFTQALSTGPGCICPPGYDGDPSSPPLLGVCLGDSIELEVHGGALGIGAEWIWYEGSCGGTDDFIGEGNSIWVSPETTTSYFVRAEQVNYVDPCSSVIVYVDTIPTATASVTDSICPGTSFTLTGGGGFHYFWTTPLDSVFETQFLIIDSASAIDEGIYGLTIESQFGCVDSTEIEVELLPAPSFTSSVQHVSCHGLSDGAIQLSSSDTLINEYEWPALGVDSSAVSGLEAGTYIAIVANNLGCSSGASILVNEPPALIDSLDVRPAYCYRPTGGAKVFMSTGEAPYEINWSNGSQNVDSIADIGTGMYSVTVTDAAGCLDSSSFMVPNLGFFDTVIEPDSVFLEYPEVGFAEAYPQPEEDVQLYNWFPDEAVGCNDCASTELNPENSMYIYVEITSDKGCFSRDSVFVDITFPPPTVFIPNVFSPNGDGLNDELCVMGYRILTCVLNIYDKWGNKVFDTSSPDFCWDGKINGVEASGTYTYTLEAVLEEGKNVSERGSIQIMR
jgi:gliding motility-associated-like protein